MTRFLTQAMLSVVVALGLTAGLSPDMKFKAKQTLQEIMIVLDQKVDSAVHNLGNKLRTTEIGADIDAEAGAKKHGRKPSVELLAESEIKAQSKSDLDVGKLFKGFVAGKTNVEVEGNAEARTEMPTGDDRFDLGMLGNIESDLDLDLDLRK